MPDQTAQGHLVEDGQQAGLSLLVQAAKSHQLIVGPRLEHGERWAVNRASPTRLKATRMCRESLSAMGSRTVVISKAGNNNLIRCSQE